MGSDEADVGAHTEYLRRAPVMVKELAGNATIWDDDQHESAVKSHGEDQREAATPALATAAACSWVEWGARDIPGCGDLGTGGVMTLESCKSLCQETPGCRYLEWSAGGG